MFLISLVIVLELRMLGFTTLNVWRLLSIVRFNRRGESYTLDFRIVGKHWIDREDVFSYSSSPISHIKKV